MGPRPNGGDIGDIVLQSVAPRGNPAVAHTNRG